MREKIGFGVRFFVDYAHTVKHVPKASCGDASHLFRFAQP